jgi:uncharacterized protein YsxB (DUF464 family)
MIILGGKMLEQSNNKVLPYIICAAMSCAIGFYVAKSQYVREDLSVIENKTDGSLLISYKNTPHRKLFAEQGAVKLGTLSQRLEDLLSENPHKIRQLTKESISH